jgi:hypothetical protein
MAELPGHRYPTPMDTIAFGLMASALTFSGFVVLLGWR